LLQAAALDSTFTVPLIWALRSMINAIDVVRAESVAHVLETRRPSLAPWDRAMLDHSLAELRENLPEAYAAMRRVVELAPNSEWELELAYWALVVNRPNEAIARLRRIDPERPLRPNAPRLYWNTLLTARHLIGDFDGELADIQHMRRLRGESSQAAALELSALAASGRIADVNRIVEVSLASTDWNAGSQVMNAVGEFRAHGFADAANHLLERLVRWYAAFPPAGPPHQREMPRAIALFAAGRNAEARTLFQRVVVEDTSRWTATGFMAQAAARTGDREAAERGIRWLLEQGSRPSGGEAIIHAAAVAAELGDRERAVQLARLAISRGFYYTMSSVHKQPRLVALWDIPAARALLRPRG
jgi:predicted Zn-dependent protease